jgi:hypothetical protein
MYFCEQSNRILSLFTITRTAQTTVNFHVHIIPQFMNPQFAEQSSNLMLAFASTVILGPESFGTQEHILLSHGSVCLLALFVQAYTLSGGPGEEIRGPLGDRASHFDKKVKQCQLHAVEARRVL